MFDHSFPACAFFLNIFFLNNGDDLAHTNTIPQAGICPQWLSELRQVVTHILDNTMHKLTFMKILKFHTHSAYMLMYVDSVAERDNVKSVIPQCAPH